MLERGKTLHELPSWLVVGFLRYCAEATAVKSDKLFVEDMKLHSSYSVIVEFDLVFLL